MKLEGRACRVWVLAMLAILGGGLLLGLVGCGTAPTATLEPSVETLVQAPTLTPPPTPTPSPTPTRQPSATLTATATPTPSPSPPSATPTETPVFNSHQIPTDQELYRFLLDSYYQLPEDEGQGFDYFLWKGTWLRWDKDLDGDGRSEIIVAATDPERRYLARFAILEWKGQAYTINLDFEEYGHYGADIRVAFEDVNNDGIDEIVVDTLVYSGGTGMLDGWFERKLVYCLDGRCWVSWAQELGQAGRYFSGMVDGNAGVSAKQCRPEYLQMDDDVYFELRQRCGGYSIDMRYVYDSEDEEWPYPYSAYKHLDPVVETVFDWDGRTYTQVSREELSPGQEVTEEDTIWTREATDTVWNTVDRVLEEQTPPGGSISSEAYQELINRSWGIQDQERVVAAALGDVAPFSGEDIVGVIATTRLGIGRLVTLRLEPDGLYTPAVTITVPCEPSFARLETLDLNGDSQGEILFNTIILTEAEPVVYDQLSIYAWGETGLELLFQGIGAFPNSTTRGIYAADLDDDGVYEIVQEHFFFDLELWDPDWPTLDRIYSVYKWDAETDRYHFWQKRREPYDHPGEIEILEQATP